MRDVAILSSGNNQREIVGIVWIAVAHRRTVEDDSVVQERRAILALLNPAHLIHHVGEHRVVELIDLRVFAKHLLIFPVVGDAVHARVGHSIQEAESLPSNVILEEHGGDPGLIHLKGQDNDIEHEFEVLLGVLGNPSVRTVNVRLGD